MAIRVRIDGERALFARPEFRRDLVTYDVLTPHAARGMLDCLYWRPGMVWVVDVIHTLHSPVLESVEEKGRRSIILRDVSYIVDAHFEVDDGSTAGTSGRHSAMIARAAKCPTQVYLGNPSFSGTLTTMEGRSVIDVEGARRGTIEHGWLLHSIAFTEGRQPRYFQGQSVDGAMQVPSASSPSLYV